MEIHSLAMTSAFAAQHPFLLLLGAVSLILFRKSTLPHPQPEIQPYPQVQYRVPSERFRRGANQPLMCSDVVKSAQLRFVFSLKESLFSAQLGSA